MKIRNQTERYGQFVAWGVVTATAHRQNDGTWSVWDACDPTPQYLRPADVTGAPSIHAALRRFADLEG